MFLAVACDEIYATIHHESLDAPLTRTLRIKYVCMREIIRKVYGHV